MIINNIKFLLAHVLISILSIIIFMIFHISTAKWISEEAANNHHINMLIIAIIIIIVALFLYYYFSKVFLINQGSNFKNIMSFSLTALIGIVLWLAAYSIDLTNGTKILLNSQFWRLYSLYYGYCLFFVDEAVISSPYIMLIFWSLPILAIWFGIRKSAMNKICGHFL